jgi:hypothetical protein
MLSHGADQLALRAAKSRQGLVTQLPEKRRDFWVESLHISLRRFFVHRCCSWNLMQFSSLVFKRSQTNKLDFIPQFFRKPTNQKVESSSPSGRTSLKRSGPETWVTQRT